MRRSLIGLVSALCRARGGGGALAVPTQCRGGQPRRPPKYSVDPCWPRALPHQWQIGQVPGIAVDKHDNIWIVQRPLTLTSDERGASDFEPGTPPALDGAARPQGATRTAACRHPR